MAARLAGVLARLGCRSSVLGFGMLSGDLLMTKVADRVLAIRSGKAPDLSDVVEAEGADLSEEE